ncbi:hypothetical protein PIIN_11300 [Serendipita indica DSM 11827]|uniref:Uncharacterized protein n=1 Tax=Serendipita indica (strain DSM 11827) TaxID=1109443 RepID=G4U180_SERID|nr:hypothetical protein PIIN_11300 [Serendipita indica DSM 11827]
MPADGPRHQQTRSLTLATTLSDLRVQDSSIADELGIGSYDIVLVPSSYKPDPNQTGSEMTSKSVGTLNIQDSSKAGEPGSSHGGGSNAQDTPDTSHAHENSRTSPMSTLWGNSLRMQTVSK